MTTPRNTILHADCLDALPQLPAASVNFVLTDPPYITRYQHACASLFAKDFPKPSGGPPLP